MFHCPAFQAKWFLCGYEVALNLETSQPTQPEMCRSQNKLLSFNYYFTLTYLHTECVSI